MQKIFAELLLGFDFENDILRDSFNFLIFHNKDEVAAHSRKVAIEAEKLAEKFGINKDKALKAGFLHELAILYPMKVWKRLLLNWV